MKWAAFALACALGLPRATSDHYTVADRIICHTLVVTQPKRAFQGDWKQVTRTIRIQCRHVGGRWYDAETFDLDDRPFPEVMRVGPHSEMVVLTYHGLRNFSRPHRFRTRQVIYTHAKHTLFAAPQ